MRLGGGAEVDLPIDKDGRLQTLEVESTAAPTQRLADALACPIDSRVALACARPLDSDRLDLEPEWPRRQVAEEEVHGVDGPGLDRVLAVYLPPSAFGFGCSIFFLNSSKWNSL